jgi:hypothetical protein
MLRDPTPLDSTERDEALVQAIKDTFNATEEFLGAIDRIDLTLDSERYRYDWTELDERYEGRECSDEQRDFITGVFDEYEEGRAA